MQVGFVGTGFDGTAGHMPGYRESGPQRLLVWRRRLRLPRRHSCRRLAIVHTGMPACDQDAPDCVPKMTAVIPIYLTLSLLALIGQAKAQELLPLTRPLRAGPSA